MAQKIINTSMPNDGLGDALRDAFNDTNANFTELYANKVDKVPGQGLSDNNFTDDLLTKLNNIDEEASINTQSDWLQNDNTKDDYIKNKPNGTTLEMRYPIMLPFDFIKNTKNVVNNLHGSFLMNDSEDGIALNPSTPIAGTGGISKVLAAVLAGTVTTGSFTITGTSVDRDTGVETPGDSEIVEVDGLSTNNSTTDANGNPVHDYSDTYMSSKWWKGSLTFSTGDLNLSEIRFAQVAYEQVNDSNRVEVETLDANYTIENSAAGMDAYLYSVTRETDSSKARVRVISELHHETGLEVNASFRRRKSGINEILECTREGVFLDIFFLPLTQEYFTNFTVKIWGSRIETAEFLLDNTLTIDTITYGEALSSGEVAYLADDGKYYKADNTDVSKASTQIRLIIEGGIADEEKKAIKSGTYNTSGLTAGNEFLGTNGAITPTQPTAPGEVVRLLSTAISSTKRYFNPSTSWVLADGTNINGVDLITSTETISDAWSVGGLDVRAYAINAPILDGIYSAEAQTITVNPAPATPGEFRYIAIVMDVNGIISAQDGAEGTAVLPPTVDTDQYFLIRYLLIANGDTSPGDQNGNSTSTFDLLYQETGTEAGGESDVSTNVPSIITINETGSPFGGVGIRAVNPSVYGTSKVDFTHTTKRKFSDLTSLNFNFQLDNLNRRIRLYVEFYDGNTRVANIRVSSGYYGYSAQNLAPQNINIPKEFLTVIGTEYDRVRIYFGTPNGTIDGYWLDNVQLLNAFGSNPNNPTVDPQIQSDWNQTDETAVDYIKNKPAVGMGDMTKAVYDPNTKEADAFAMDNMSNMSGDKATPIDADNFTLWDSVTSVFKKVTFANLKTVLKTYFDTLYSKVITSRIVDNSVTGTYNLDHSLASDWKLTLTGTTTITESNLPTGINTIEFTLKITGDFPLIVPSYWEVVGDSYDGTKFNFFACQIHNGVNPNEEATIFISNL